MNKLAGFQLCLDELLRDERVTEIRYGKLDQQFYAGKLNLLTIPK